jgi:hypothetical protein
VTYARCVARMEPRVGAEAPPDGAIRESARGRPRISQALHPGYGTTRRCLPPCANTTAAAYGSQPSPDDAIFAPNQNIENNPMQSNKVQRHGCLTRENI